MNYLGVLSHCYKLNTYFVRVSNDSQKSLQTVSQYIMSIYNIILEINDNFSYHAHRLIIIIVY